MLLFGNCKVVSFFGFSVFVFCRCFFVNLGYGAVSIIHNVKPHDPLDAWHRQISSRPSGTFLVASYYTFVNYATKSIHIYQG